MATGSHRGYRSSGASLSAGTTEADATTADAQEKPLANRLPELLRPEPTRVVLRPFTPGEGPMASADSAGTRQSRIIDRVLALDQAELDATLTDIERSLSRRHRDVARVLRRRFLEISDPCAASRPISPQQARLIGAYFTEEYSFEAAALFNPSVIAHPDQAGVAPGCLRLLLSLRGVGEGHVSSIIFRTGLLGADGRVTIDPPSAYAVSPRVEHVPGGVPDDPGVRLVYGGAHDLSELVIFPVTLRQRHGIEDLRLTRFVEDDGDVSYIGTYTAFSGQAVREELLRTSNFKTFELNALRGSATATKGMALFPRRIDGHYAMLGRQDHENIWLLKSNELYAWDGGTVTVRPRWPWEFVQIGNCGSPIEIDEGWLVITHGVGPVRNYCLGACLLDKRNPTRLIARLREPLVTPMLGERDGYVPNVAYSCGALVHGRTLLLPYGVADNITRFATVTLDALLAAMG